MKFFSNKMTVICVTLVAFLAIGWFYKGYLIRMAGWPFLANMDPPAAGVIRFAAIGDYGSGSLGEGDVAKVIKSWRPEFIITLGDNNYELGGIEAYDATIGRFYHEYIAPYDGSYGKGADVNRFFPIPGHRDWDTDQLKPYLDFFTLPGNERYYDLVRGPVHLFMIDSDEREPDGGTENSKQANWLKQQLANDNSHWKIVCAHHAPYTSHHVEDVTRMRWPFKQWGADAVLSGYYHIYERLYVDGLTYLVNGAGGSWVSDFGDIDPNSRVRYNGDFGALMIEANNRYLSFKFINRKGLLIDSYTIEK
jgi:tartrate-resistant acid phosphatase type 5